MSATTGEEYEELIKGVGILLLIAGAILLLPIAIYGYLSWKDRRRHHYSRKRLLCGLICFGVGGLLFRYAEMCGKSNLKLANISGVWVLGVGALILLVPVLYYFKGRDSALRTIDFEHETRDSIAFAKIFSNPHELPIGTNVQTGELVRITSDARTAHMLVIGATGTGKTTLMVLMILHAIKHNQPCVIIDPKGDDSTLNQIIRIGMRLNPKLRDRLKVFSMSSPEKSCHYNPLKHGNANQLKDRIMEALNWSEQFYQSVAGSYLTTITACTTHLKIPISLRLISRILTQKEEQLRLLSALKKSYESGDEMSLELFNRLNQIFSKSKDSDLAGLSAQIAILDNPTFGHLLSFNESNSELDLRDVRSNAGIAYFQLDTLGNGDSARRLGRMIIEDLKALSSEVYKSEPNENERMFFPVFIDEFGSFAASEFVSFIKQSRGARFAVHLFCQGLEDLDKVSKEFRRQMVSNPLTKISLRVDDSETVNEFCATAGTKDALESSYQVEKGVFSVMRTGMGNQRETKQMMIEHDVLKRLKRGQAVVVEKSPLKLSGVKVFNPEALG